MKRASTVLTILLAAAALPSCGLLDWARSLGGPGVECPEGAGGPHTLELMMVGDELSCPLFETVREDLVEGGPVWILEEPISILGQGGHPCHLASHDRDELSAVVETLETPDGSSVALGEDRFGDGKSTWMAYILEEPARVTSEHVAKAHVKYDENTMTPIVMVDLTDVGARAFELLTASNIARRLAIVVDGEVVSAPIIREKIPGGRMQINLGMTGSHDEIYCRAQALVDFLNGG